MNINTFNELLKEEGFRPKVDNDGDIVFKYEGNTVFLESSQDDSNFVRLVLPNFWAIESEAESAKAIEVAHEVTRTIKVAKVFLVENDVWTSAELFLPDENSLGAVLHHVLNVVQGASLLFAKKMREQPKIEA